MRPAAIALALTLGLSGCAVAQDAEPQTRLVSQIGWSADIEDFGGFSALDVASDGRSLVAISDRNLVVEADILRDAQGDMTGFVITQTRRLSSTDDGAPDAWRWADSEGMTPDGQGGYYVSFEREHRVVHFADLSLPGTVLERTAFAHLQENSGLEALARDGSGRLLAIPERSGRETRPFPVYRYADGVWTVPFAVPRRPPFLITGAEVGPDGRLYVLERHFTGFSFATRVRSFALGDQLGDERIVVPVAYGRYDNAEGIDLWRDAAGQLRLVLIADNNFSMFQRNLISEFVLD